jgi:hypothetical protein
MALGWADSGSAARGGLPKCQADLNTCSAALDKTQKFPATGQTTSYQIGDDGDIKAGAPLNYTDTGDTIIDNNTKLEWEKKAANNVDDVYIWFDAFNYIAFLNTPTSCFAGHCDWRLPNVKELQSIVDYQIPSGSPTVSALFGPTASNFYWSSTSFATDTNGAWAVNFGVGDLTGFIKDGVANHVRAVRGGL